MKKARANISLFELTNMTSQWDILLRALGLSSAGNLSPSNKGYGTSFDSLESILHTLSLEVNTLCPPFLLTFEIFNLNVHNYLVDSGALVNVMQLSIAKKINATWSKNDAHNIQLDRTLFLAINELRDVFIFLSYNERVH